MTGLKIILFRKKNCDYFGNDKEKFLMEFLRDFFDILIKTPNSGQAIFAPKKHSSYFRGFLNFKKIVTVKKCNFHLFL